MPGFMSVILSFAQELLTFRKMNDISALVSLSLYFVNIAGVECK